MANPAEARGALASWLAVPDTIEMTIAGLEDAALDASGAVYDWSWVCPSDAWNERMGYAKAPVTPAIQALRALGHLRVLAEIRGGGGHGR